MSYFLFLDDMRNPKDAFCYDEMKKLETLSGVPNGNWKIARTLDEFVHAIQTQGIPLKVSFDCDLHDEHMRHFMMETQKSGIYEWQNFKHGCGVHCAAYLKSKLTKDNNIKVYVHSANPVGCKIIKDLLKEFLYDK